MANISGGFADDRAMADRPIVSLCVLLLIANSVFFGGVLLVRRVRAGFWPILWLILAGLIMRLVMVWSTPMLEDDYLRYLLDGALTANGFNPYRYSPNQIVPNSPDIPVQLQTPAQDGRAVIARINHPHLRTIYPPVAQSIFAVAYMIKPWSLIAWRAVILVFDVATFLLIAWGLRSFGVSALWSMIYWWNPLIIKEFINSAHMDVIVAPLALAAALLATRGRYLWTAIALALATGAKLWPVILAPLAFAPLIGQPRRLLVAGGVMTAICVVIFAPVYLTGLDANSGFTAYGRAWEMNDALYMALLWGMQRILPAFHMEASSAQLMTRLLAAVFMIGLVAWLATRRGADSSDLMRRSLFVVAALFLISPTQFPWYFGWVIPFLAFHPVASLIPLNGLLSLYYLRFYFLAHDMVGYFDYGVVWLEYAPVWFLLIWEYARSRKISRSPCIGSAAE